VQCRVAAVLGGVDGCATFDQERRYFVAPGRGRAVDGAEAGLVRSERVRVAPGVEQQARALRVAAEEGGQVQRGEAVVGGGAGQLGCFGQCLRDPLEPAERSRLKEVEPRAFCQTCGLIAVTAVEGGEDR
jgi:hypothetical protein